MTSEDKKNTLFHWPAIACGALIASSIFLGSIYIYKVNNFEITEVKADGIVLNEQNGDISEIFLTSNSPKIEISFSGIPSRAIKASFAQQEVKLNTNWLTGTSSGTVEKLTDGKYALSVSASEFNKNWLLTLDTKPPEVKISHPRPGYKSNKNSITLQGTTEPEAFVSASITEEAFETQANEKGFFSIALPTKSGLCTIKWSVKDKAGNKTSGTNEFLCDFTPPELNIALIQAPYKGSDGKAYDKKQTSPKEPYTIFTSKTLTLKAEISDPDSGIAKTEIYIDGELRQSKDYSAEKHEHSEEAVPQEQESAEAPKESGKSISFAYDIPVLYEGTHTISVTAYNAFGLSSKRSITFGTNTTETYGHAPLGLGAVGNDVKELQRKLKQRGYLSGEYTEGKYDKKTQEAVLSLQKEIGAAQDGIAGVLVTSALESRIYVNLSKFSAVLVDESGNPRYYPIAVGVKEHPTCTGLFYIADMAKNPTWLPPNSEWAKDAKQIPPGPDNPLGTRWIGIGNSIGFHGTNAPGSIGTRASHGCMRMTIPDVEDLYDRVSVGTQVQIFEGDEDNPIIKQYW